MTQAYLDLLNAALAPTRIAGRKPIAPPPRGVPSTERTYERGLVRWNRKLVKMVAQELKPVLATATDDSRRDAFIDVQALLRALANIRRRIGSLVGSAVPLVRETVEKLSKENHRDLSRILPIAISEQGAQIETLVTEWRRGNVELIESIATRLLDDVEEVVTLAATSGMRVETLTKRIQERFRVSESRARLIAVDQTLKGNADLTRARHLQAGVTSYVWTTSRDERVRPSHRRLDRQVFTWDNPPSVGHPGEDYRCRCTARPVLD